MSLFKSHCYMGLSYLSYPWCYLCQPQKYFLLSNSSDYPTQGFASWG
jgi:hypothetical protein